MKENLPPNPNLMLDVYGKHFLTKTALTGTIQIGLIDINKETHGCHGHNLPDKDSVC
jgi:hypothetical protein